ncbi:MAG TPA: helix-turn-helix transcriptional regulator [Vicinamibacterales bacterium]|jgi:transcriptional regulator with XRE-family HTH domain
MNSTFGARLKAQREQQQIALTTISERTKIKQSLLEALERDDVRHWPQGLFGRSYLRSYAQAIGLDPDATLREFMECHPAESPAPLNELRDKTAERSNRWPPTRLQFLIDSAIDAFHTRRVELTQKAGLDLSSPAAGPRMEQTGPAAAHSDTLSADQPTTPVDFLALAKLCTKLACAEEAPELTSVLEDAAGVLSGVGLILWIPDAMGVALTTAFAYGYPAEMIAQLPSVSAEATNAIAEAFRTRTTCVVTGTAADNGAIVAPLLTPSGCSGVISLEVRAGAEQRDEVRAALTILAAQVSTLMGFSVLAHTRSA